MKRLLIFIGLLALLSCGKERSKHRVDALDRYTIVVVDGCEYLEVQGGYADNRYYSLTHKGNCNNPVHPRVNKSVGNNDYYPIDGYMTVGDPPIKWQYDTTEAAYLVKDSDTSYFVVDKENLERAKKRKTGL